MALPRGPPPPLPPRSSQTSFNEQVSPSLSSAPPPPYSPWPDTLSRDPRNSSTQSLVPSTAQDGQSFNRRTLLMVYIHGFYGNEQSFRSFPFHVHEKLRNALSETHTIHSKIYPRYKTYKAFEVAIERFSSWLEPHESPTTDVILVGHSMGGLVAADVALMPQPNPSSRGSPFKHRLLATLSLDSPFLGLHPGIIPSGIASLFQPAQVLLSSHRHHLPSPHRPSQHSPDGVSTASPAMSPDIQQSADPLFNPSFFNDQRVRDRSFIGRLANFATKHRSEGILGAVWKHSLSHLEYGGILADYPALSKRYYALRRRDDAEEDRVRFANYYTISFGRIIQPAQSDPLQPVSSGNSQDVLNLDTVASGKDEKESEAGTETPSTPDLQPLSFQEPEPIDEETVLEAEVEDDNIEGVETQDIDQPATTEESTNIPPIPPTPGPPTLPDIAQCTDKNSLKQAEKETKRLLKEYDAAMDQYNKLLRVRRKLIEKEAKEREKETAKLEKQNLKVQRQQDKEEEKRQRKEEKRRLQDQGGQDDRGQDEDATKKEKKEKGKKFCMLPSKRDGVPDPTWVSIRVDGMDEIGAHCGLFLEGEPHYEVLVKDVVKRIQGWVGDEIHEGQ